MIQSTLCCSTCRSTFQKMVLRAVSSRSPAMTDTTIHHTGTSSCPSGRLHTIFVCVQTEFMRGFKRNCIYNVIQPKELKVSPVLFLWAGHPAGFLRAHLSPHSEPWSEERNLHMVSEQRTNTNSERKGCDYQTTSLNVQSLIFKLWPTFKKVCTHSLLITLTMALSSLCSPAASHSNRRHWSPLEQFCTVRD